MTGSAIELLGLKDAEVKRRRAEALEAIRAEQEPAKGKDGPR